MNLREMRQRAGLTQTELAKRMANEYFPPVETDRKSKNKD